MLDQSIDDLNLPRVNRIIRLLAIAPFLVASLSLTLYFVSVRVGEFDDLLTQKGIEITRHLAEVSELGMFSGDQPVLRSFALSATSDPDVTHVSFYNRQGQLLAAVGKSPLPAPVEIDELTISEQGRYRFFALPIVDIPTTGIDEAEFSVTGVLADNDPPLGWVQVLIDKRRMMGIQNESYILGGVICLIGALIAWAIKVLIDKLMIAPIKELEKSIQQIEEGAFITRAPGMPLRELNNLATGINRMASRLGNWNEELQAQVVNATGQLQQLLADLNQRNTQLELTQEELIETSRIKDDFLARMSHELRTPLTSILGYNKLQVKAQDSEFLAYNRIIEQSAQLLLSIIEDLLYISKISSGTIELEVRAFEIDQCVKDVVSMHVPHAFEQGLEFAVLIESDVPVQIIGDELRLKQIMTNLISNAVKFTQHGYVFVCLGKGETRAGRFELVLRVADTGIGISEEQQANLFNQFSQADTSISRRFGGAGLGLAIVKGLAELMEGDIELHSPNPTGTEAVCRLWLDYASNDQKFKSPVPILGKVIIFEANPLSARVLRSLSFRWSSSVAITKTSDELMACLANMPECELLIIGYSDQLPHRQAIPGLIDKVRKLSQAPLLLVGGIGESTLELDPEYWGQLQPIAHITKPAFHDDFDQAVRVLIGGSKAEPIFVQHAKTSSASDGSLKGVRVLVAEDNQANRHLIMSILIQAGADVHGVEDGEQAVAKADDLAFDAALLDINMPNLDGYATALLLRKDASVPVIIALTATSVSAVAEHQGADAFDEVLQKPVDDNVLVQTLMEWVCTAKNLEPGDQAPAGSFIKLDRSELQAETAQQISRLQQAALDFDRPVLRHHAHLLRGMIEPHSDAADFVGVIEWLDIHAEEASRHELARRLEAFNSLARCWLAGSSDSGGG